ncbi:MAG: FAD-dependent oxidoreductase [Syntrophales bacterium]|jgi:NADPH-dependent 2,4-dienoyl-CoA reductase/sulfur reductase-like enzyme|nr:FAD-dependent oxidoreductase [Syntrophales bacterium]MCK9527185.1 FAD-dependent oxidoreductase [Syntrophales bacterium]MDX9921690.1 FAD-dependent oxidoreductase [Syntrophales bacterium]
MPYYIGDVIKEAEGLVARTPEEFAASGIHVHLKTAVEAIEPDRGVVRTSNGKSVAYDTLVVATGTRAVMPGIPGENLEGIFVLKNLSDGIGIKTWLEKRQCKKAVIVGAGFIGMELAEAFRMRGIDTTVVHRGTLPVNRWDDELSRYALDELLRHDVSFIMETMPRAVEKESDGRLRLLTTDGELTADIIIFGLGVRPETTLAAEAGLALGSSGALKVNFSQRTAREEIFAAGDCAEVFHRISKEWINVPLGDVANKQGRVAGSTIGGYPMRFPGVVGAQSFKLFGLELAATGIDESEARKSGYDPVSNITWETFSSPTMAGRTRMGLKLTADRFTGQLLGAQAASNGGAVGRINTLSACLWAGMDLDEIGYLDFAYSPPYGGAWDIIHRAAQTLKRKL